MKNVKFKLKDSPELRSALQNIDITNEGTAFSFAVDSIYTIAKATGLKSKKRRHIYKRFKLVFLNSLNNLVNKYVPPQEQA